jgi:hypothetical protein
MFGGKFEPEGLKFHLNKFAGSEPATDICELEMIREWAASLTGIFGNGSTSLQEDCSRFYSNRPHV